MPDTPNDSPPKPSRHISGILGTLSLVRVTSAEAEQIRAAVDESLRRPEPPAPGTPVEQTGRDL